MPRKDYREEAAQERRRGDRLLCSELFTVRRNGELIGEGVVEDVSGHGMRLHVDVQLFAGEPISLCLGEEARIVVVRFCTEAEQGLYDAGVEFVG